MMPPKIGHIFNTMMKLKWAQHTGKKDHLCPKKQSLIFSLLHSVHVSVSQRIYVSELRVCISQNICHSSVFRSLCIAEFPCHRVSASQIPTNCSIYEFSSSGVQRSQLSVSESQSHSFRVRISDFLGKKIGFAPVCTIEHKVALLLSSEALRRPKSQHSSPTQSLDFPAPRQSIAATAADLCNLH